MNTAEFGISNRVPYLGIEISKASSTAKTEKEESPPSSSIKAVVQNKTDLSKEDDLREEDALCIKLESDGQTDEHYAFKNNLKLEQICEPTEEARQAQETLLQKTLVFPFEKDPHNKPCKKYSLTVGYQNFLDITKKQRESYGPPIKSIRQHGSSGAKALGSKGCQKTLEKLGAQYCSHIQEIDASHIDEDVDDVDIFIDMRVDGNPFACGPHISAETGIINHLISLHHEKLAFKIYFDDRSSIVKQSFKSLVEHLYIPENRFGNNKTVVTIEVDGEEIPWLKGVKMVGIELDDFYKQIEYVFSGVKNTPNLFSFLNQLACDYLFKSKTMYEFIKRNAFVEFEHIQAEAPIGNTTEVIKFWDRLVLRDTEGVVNDILLCYVSKVRKKRVAFQGISLDLLPRLNGVKTVAIKGTLQALYDKYNRLIRWVNLEHAKPTDYAIYWMLVAKQYRCVLPDTQEKLLKVFLKHCNRYSTPAVAFINVISERLDKRSSIKPDLNFAFIFNALSHLPADKFSSAEIYPILNKLKRYVFVPKLPLPTSLNLLASTLFEKKVGIRALMALLQILAWHHRLGSKSERSLAPLKAHPTFHGRIQIVIDGRAFTFASDLVQAFNTFVDAYLDGIKSKDEKGLKALSDILSRFKRTDPYYFDEGLDVQKRFRDVDHEKLIPLAEKALKSNDAELFKQGYILLLFCFAMNPTKENWIKLVRYFPEILHHEKNIVSRSTILTVLEKNIKQFLPDLEGKELEFLMKKLRILSTNLTFDSKVINVIFLETLLRVKHKELNKIILNSWDFFMESITLQKFKKSGLSLLNYVSAKMCLKIIKTLEKQWTSEEFADCIERVGYTLFNSSQSTLEELQNFYTLFDRMQKCLKVYPNLKARFEQLVVTWLKEQCQEKKVEKALKVAWMAMMHGCLSLEPLCQAGKIYVQEENSNQDEIKKCLEVLASTCQAENASQNGQLYLEFFIFLAQQNKGKHPEIQETVEIQCQNLILRAKNKTKLLIELKSKGLLQNPSAIWFKIVEDCFIGNGLEGAVNKWNEGKQENIWEQLDFNAHSTFFSNFLEQLFASNNTGFIQFAESLYALLKVKSPNPNIENIFKKHSQKVNGAKLRQECTIKKAKKAIEETLKIINLQDQAEVASSKAFIKTWFVSLIRANEARRTEALKLIQNESLHRLYKEYPIEFIDLCQNCLRECIQLNPNYNLKQYISILNLFFQKQPVSNSLDKAEVALYKFFESLKKKLKLEDLLSAMDLLATIKTVYFPLWVLITEPIYFNEEQNLFTKEKDVHVDAISDAAKKSAAKKALGLVEKVLIEYPKSSNMDKYSEWHELELLKTRFLIGLYCTEPDNFRNKVKEEFATLQNENDDLNQIFKAYKLFELRLSQFLAIFLAKIDQYNFEILIKDFRETVEVNLQKLEGFLNDNSNTDIKLRIGLAYSKILMRGGEEDFLKACHLIKEGCADRQLFKNEKFKETLYFHIVALLHYQKIHSYKGTGVNLKEIFELYQTKLIFHFDPCYVIQVLSELSEEPYIIWAAELALHRFKNIKDYRERINDEIFKQTIKIIYLQLAEKLKDSSSSKQQEILKTLMRHPEWKQIVGEKQVKQLRKEVISGRKNKIKLPRNAINHKLSKENQRDIKEVSVLCQDLVTTFTDLAGNTLEGHFSVHSSDDSNSADLYAVSKADLCDTISQNPILSFFINNPDLESNAQNFWNLLIKMKTENFLPQQGSKRVRVTHNGTSKLPPKFKYDYKLISLFAVINIIQSVFIEYLYRCYQVNSHKVLDIKKFEEERKLVIKKNPGNYEGGFDSVYIVPRNYLEHEESILKAMGRTVKNSAELNNNNAKEVPDAKRLPLFMFYMWYHIQQFISLYPKQIASILRLFAAFLHYPPFRTKEIEEMHYKLCHLIIPQDFLESVSANFPLKADEFFLLNITFYGKVDKTIPLEERERKELIWEKLDLLLNHSCVVCNAKAHRIIYENVLYFLWEKKEKEGDLFAHNPYKFCFCIADLLTHVLGDPIQESYYSNVELVNMITLLTTYVPQILFKMPIQLNMERLKLWKSLLNIYRKAINNFQIEKQYREQEQSLQATALSVLGLGPKYGIVKKVGSKGGVEEHDNIFEAELKEFSPLILSWHNNNVSRFDIQIKYKDESNESMPKWKKNCMDKGLLTYKLHYAETLYNVWGTIGPVQGEEWRKVSNEIFKYVMDALLKNPTDGVMDALLKKPIEFDDNYYLRMMFNTLKTGFESSCFIGDYLAFISYADVVITALCAKRSDLEISRSGFDANQIVALSPSIGEILLKEGGDTVPLDQIEKQRRVDVIMKWLKAVHDRVQIKSFLAGTHDITQYISNPILKEIFNDFPGEYQKLQQLSNPAKDK